jgi:hypothetical protein
VNPGAILCSTKKKPGVDEQQQPIPCFLFFDSLKAHQKDAVVTKLVKWLNAEWGRLDKSDATDTTENNNRPFSLRSMELVAPKSKFYALVFGTYHH